MQRRRRIAGGSYYEGVSDKPLFLDRAPKARNEAVLRRDNGTLDRTSTGAVDYRSEPRVVRGGEGEYYQGLTR